MPSMGDEQIPPMRAVNLFGAAVVTGGGGTRFRLERERCVQRQRKNQVNTESSNWSIQTFYGELDAVVMR